MLPGELFRVVASPGRELIGDLAEPSLGALLDLVTRGGNLAGGVRLGLGNPGVGATPGCLLALFGLGGSALGGRLRSLGLALGTLGLGEQAPRLGRLGGCASDLLGEPAADLLARCCGVGNEGFELGTGPIGRRQIRRDHSTL
jgi:hypothetical protein